MFALWFILILPLVFQISWSKPPVIKYCAYNETNHFCQPSTFGSNSKFNFSKPTENILKPDDEGLTRGFIITCLNDEPIRWLLNVLHLEVDGSPDQGVIIQDERHQVNGNTRRNGERIYYLSFRLKLSRLPPTDGVIRCLNFKNEEEYSEMFLLNKIGMEDTAKFLGNYNSVKYFISRPYFNATLNKTFAMVPCPSFGAPPIGIEHLKILRVPRRNRVLHGVSDECLNCICHPQCEHEDCLHRACYPVPPLNFSVNFWEEGGHHYPWKTSPVAPYEECMKDYECSAITIREYMQREKMDCNRDGLITCEDYVRIYRQVRRPSDDEMAKEILKFHRACLNKADIDEIQVNVTFYDPRIGALMDMHEFMRADFDSSLYICSNLNNSEQITFSPLNEGNKLESSIIYRPLTRNEGRIICEVHGSTNPLRMLLYINPCRTLSECDLKIRPFYGVSWYVGKGDMADPDSQNNIRVEKELWAKHGMIGCYGVEDDPRVNRSISYATHMEYFFTGLDSKKYLTSQEIPAPAVLQVTASTPELYDGAKENFHCEGSTFLLFPVLQFSIEYSDGTMELVPLNATESNVDGKSEWSQSLLVEITRGSGTASRVLYLTVRSTMNKISCMAPWVNSTDWLSQALPIKVPAAPSGFISQRIMIPFISALVLALILAVVMGIQFSRAKAKSKKLTWEEVLEFYYGNNQEGIQMQSASNNDMVNIDSLAFPEEFKLSHDGLVFNEEDELGRGQYGRCFKGQFCGREVAVKTTKYSLDRACFKAFLQEAKLMAYIGKHENVVEFIGAYVDNIENFVCLVVMEFSPFGNVRDFLRRHEGAFNFGVPRLTFLNLEDLYNFGFQIASGMEYLCHKKVIHGDLAARNVLVFDGMRVKITDFGLSKQLYGSAKLYARRKKSESEPMPWRWMAPESIKFYQFSTKSDMWSFGVTLWEIFSLGQIPFPTSTEKGFLEDLDSGVRLNQPRLASVEMYDFMMSCWYEDPAKRPSFTEAMDFCRGRILSSTEDGDYSDGYVVENSDQLQFLLSEH